MMVEVTAPSAVRRSASGTRPAGSAVCHPPPGTSTTRSAAPRRGGSRTVALMPGRYSSAAAAGPAPLPAPSRGCRGCAAGRDGEHGRQRGETVVTNRRCRTGRRAAHTRPSSRDPRGDGRTGGAARARPAARPGNGRDAVETGRVPWLVTSPDAEGSTR